ncbi:hypothetical protein HDU80_003167, partial [Chytriomyces hyalinus]
MSRSAEFATLDEAIPPCALACTAAFTSLEAACPAVPTISACGAAACVGTDLILFNAI